MDSSLQNNVFRKDGEVWEIVFEGNKLPLFRDVKGFHYIQLLLRYPRSCFRPTELVTLVERPVISALGNEVKADIAKGVYDNQNEEKIEGPDSLHIDDAGEKEWLDDYRDRARIARKVEKERQDLFEALKKAESNKDENLIKQLHQQIALCNQYLNKSFERTDEHERDRKRASQAIERALDKIKNKDLVLHTHFVQTLKKWSDSLVYDGSPHIIWTTDQEKV